MTLPTHKTGGIATAVLFTPSIYILVSSNMSYVFALAICCLTAKIGAEIPDLDLNWDCIKKKRSIWRKVLNRIFWLMGCKHRSWQTHCYLITPIPMLIVIGILLNVNSKSIDKEILLWLTIGLAVGVVSHLILDSFTTKGVHLVPGVTVRFLPKSLGVVTGSVFERYLLVFCIGLIVYGIYNSLALIKDSIYNLTLIVTK